VESLQEKLKLNPFVSLQNDFSSYFRIEKHIQTSTAFKYIHPVEVKLPADAQGKKATFHYIPVINTLNAIITDPTFTQTKATAGDLIQDIKDGSAWQDNEYFQNNPDAYTGVLYSDAVEICNPLGAAKGKHKIVNVYLTLVEIPKHLRSKVENWFLVLTVNERDLKANREAVYKPLLDDLKRLEQGLQVGEKFLQMGIVAHLGDNLESHTVGGFSSCFSSKDICRNCHLQFSELPNITGLPTASKWTQAEYDEAVRTHLEKQPGDKSQSQFGVSGSCVFNVLESFSAVGQFPFDSMHDFFEKIGPYDAQAGLLTLISQDKFTLLEYNALLRDLQLKGTEAGDRPPPVKPNGDKLPGKALAVSLHIRLMPLLLQRLLREDEKSVIVDLLLIIHELREYIMADALSPADILAFEELVVQYFSKRKECSDRFPVFPKLTPRYHFLEHYPEQMAKFGPFPGVWTARCESRHRDYVNFSESSKNFINLLKTLAEKDQKKMACRFDLELQHVKFEPGNAFGLLG
jgi:hypothetical protein